MVELSRVLCVDDEPRVVKGLALHLRGRFEALTALSGEEALQQLSLDGNVAVIISDMRMPGMDGAALLAKVRVLCPSTTRVLLTGEAGRDAVVTAVNQGQIFRFLTKPCRPEELTACVEAAVEQHRLVTAERVLLQDTLVGCIRSLLDVLALTNPVAYGRASRVRGQVMAFAEYCGYPSGFWQLEAAAMLSQIGYLSLPTEVAEKVYYGENLTPEEKVLVAAVPEVATKLLRHIPRLDPVIEILRAQSYGPEELQALAEGPMAMAVRILLLATDFDALTSQGHSLDTAAQMLQRRPARYGAALARQFATHLGSSSGEMEVVDMPIEFVRPGMVILQDVFSDMGTLLVARGFEVTERFLERIKNFGPGVLASKIQVSVPRRQAAYVSH